LTFAIAPRTRAGFPRFDPARGFPWAPSIRESFRHSDSIGSGGHMRTMRVSVSLVAAAAVALSPGAVPARAQQQDPYPATMHYGTGLINIPVAWVSPVSGDGWFNISGKRISYYGNQDATFATQMNTNVALDTHWAGRFSIGVSAYSQNPEYGFFGQALVLRDNQFSFFPALAVGFRNLGPYEHEERFLIGHDIALNENGEYEEVVPGFAEGFKTNPSFYGVLTKEFALSSMNARLPATMMSLSVGYGDGIFRDDGGNGEMYNAKGTLVDGLFLGTRLVFHPSLNSTLTVLGENDGWDWNAGAVFNWRGLSAAVYGTELEEGGKEDGAAMIYNYTKINFAFGYNGNVFDVARGVILRTRITALQREQQRLRWDIAERNRRIAQMTAMLQEAQAGELQSIARRRAEIDAELARERQAMEEAMRRLDELQRRTTPPPGTPPPSNPPPPPPTNPPPPASPSPSSI
jgi:hypothetical protein